VSVRTDGTHAWQLAAFAALATALAGRGLAAAGCPPLYDFDAAGHALAAFALFEGRLPDPREWGGFHPPVAYAAAAALWHALPPWIPVHVQMRGLSIVSGALALWCVHRQLRRLVPAADAAVATATLASSSGFAVSAGMMGNELPCALLATLALARLVDLKPQAGVLHAAATGALAGLAALAKTTGLGVVPVAALAYVLALRATPRRALACAAVLAVVAASCIAPHAVRLARLSGSSLALVSGAAASAETRALMATQPPGERRLLHYVAIPAATFVHPDADEPSLLDSVTGLLHAQLWADPFGYLWLREGSGALALRRTLALGGLLPTALAIAGAWRIVRRRELRARCAMPLAFGVLLLASLLAYAWLLPVFSAVKASYLLPALLPAGLALSVGLAACAGWTRIAARAGLLALAGLAAVASWPGVGPARMAGSCVAPGDRARADRPAAAARAYFHALAADPIRLLARLAPSALRDSGLRAWRGDDEPPEPREVAPDEAVREARLALLMILQSPVVAATAASLQPSLAGVTRTDAGAIVEVAVRSREEPPFSQRFDLRRDGACGDYRVHRIERSPAPTLAGFVAAPNEADRLALWRRLRAAEK
jgi:hypothetical protein